MRPKIQTISFVLISLVLLSCKKENWDESIENCNFSQSYNNNHPLGPSIQTLIDKYTSRGIPGISVAIYSSDGFWVGASGYARIENRQKMLPCHLQYSQSVSKTYMAVAIMKMWEMGLINLDASIVNYLPSDISGLIENANEISVRMLLNHTSGIAEYNSNPNYVSFLLEHPLEQLSPRDLIQYIDGQPAQFAPGTEYRYTNANYELLAFIGDFVTGDHSAFIRNHILIPIGATNSFYHENSEYLNKPNLVNSYWDRYSNGQIENCTDMQKTNVASMVGDDGLIATPFDFVLFLKALFNNQLVADSTLSVMLQFPFPDEEGYGYGLGIHREYYKGVLNYGHTGGGIGSGCYLNFFPDKQIYSFISINIGTAVYSPLFDESDGIMDEYFDILIQ